MIQKLNNYIEPEDEAELEEDILTSYDYYYNNLVSSTQKPEKSLAKSILIFAVIDYLSGKNKAAYRDAYNWFFKEENPDYIFSFSNICYIMGLNETKFRARLKKRKHTKSKFIVDGKRIN